MRLAALALLLPSLAGADPIAPPSPMPPRLLRTLAHRPDGYGADAAPSDLLLGDLLFHSPEILGPRAIEIGLSCNTCHPNGATHPALKLEGLSDRPGSIDLSTAHFRAGADDGIANALNIPSLRGVRYTAPYGRDGRIASLSEFTRGVVEGEFGGAPISATRLSSLVRYLHDLDFLPNRNLDERNRLTARAGDAAHRGEKLFADHCASCHPASSYFTDGKTHRVGTGKRASPYSLDDGYETPTLLDTVESAPYFHDGRAATLAEVVQFFDGSLQLHLSPDARADLVAYLEAIGTSDDKTDSRPLARRLVETFAYLALLERGEVRDDRAIWAMALDRSRDALLAAPTAPSLSLRRATALAAIAHLRAESGRGDLPSLRPEVTRVRVELARLAADLAGALP
jgi:cytochrome c peroxidase